MLDSLFAFADVADLVGAAPARGLALRVRGPFADRVPAGPANFVLRAARTLRAQAGVHAGAHLRLLKRLPPGAGLGGGTADGAAAIRLLCRLWGIDALGGAARAAAAALGADGPACLPAQASVVGGTGDEVRPARKVPEGFLVLAWPAAPLATAAVYERVAPPFSRPAPPYPGRLDLHLARSRNDLESAAFRVEPRIRAVLHALRALPGARAVRMTGSGSAAFALFESRPAAERGARLLRIRKPLWWVRAARVGR